ncbi:MAG: hypothetical protein MJZ84_07515 [Paludibacteraceae bacterium]|nr:hypothetical protein [Paludibacteraceae bacterium]
MEHNISIGRYRLGIVDSVTIKHSVETLSDTAFIVLPGSYANKTLDVEGKLKEGDEVKIELGYNTTLKTEFMGYLKTIQTDDGSITLECEDAIWIFRKEVADKEHKNITAKSLLQKIVQEVDGSFNVSCDYDFTYDKFVVKDATAFDVLKKIQDETKANIYFSGTTLHCHPQYSEITNQTPIIYDFNANVEKSDLKYKSEKDRKYFVEVEGIPSSGKRVTVTYGTMGGDKRNIKVYGVTDKESLLKRAKEELTTLVYTGFEGSFTGWLIPFCEPAYKIELRDKDYPEKNGTYYVVATEIKFSSSGGERTVTIGKKI